MSAETDDLVKCVTLMTGAHSQVLHGVNLQRCDAELWARGASSACQKVESDVPKFLLSLPHISVVLRTRGAGTVHCSQFLTFECESAGGFRQQGAGLPEAVPKVSLVELFWPAFAPLFEKFINWS